MQQTPQIQTLINLARHLQRQVQPVPVDVHTANQKAAGLPSRNNAKTFIYGFLYGAGPAKIGAIVGGTEAEGRKLINKFLKSTTALKKLREAV